MQRKGTNGRFLPEFKAVVVAWVREGEGLTYSDASRQWGVKTEHIRRWCKSEDVDEPTGFGVVGSPKAAGGGAGLPRSPQRLTSGKARAPVEDMGEEDRTRAVSTVRTLSEVLELSAAMMLAQVKRAEQLLSQKATLDSDERAELHGILSLDVKTAAAMHNISRTNGNLIDTHPGLMKLAGIKERTGDGERKLDAVAAALGLPVGDS